MSDNINVEKLKKNIGDKLKSLRTENKKTQKDLATYLSTTQQVYSRYESGKNELPIKHLIALSKYYNISADDILGIDSNHDS